MNIQDAADTIHNILNDEVLKESKGNSFKSIIDEAKEYGTYLKT